MTKSTIDIIDNNFQIPLTKVAETADFETAILLFVTFAVLTPNFGIPDIVDLENKQKLNDCEEYIQEIETKQRLHEAQGGPQRNFHGKYNFPLLHLIKTYVIRNTQKISKNSFYDITLILKIKRKHSLRLFSWNCSRKSSLRRRHVGTLEPTSI